MKTDFRGKYPITLERAFPSREWLNVGHEIGMINGDKIARTLMHQWIGIKPNSGSMRPGWIARATWRFNSVADATLFKMRFADMPSA